MVHETEEELIARIQALEAENKRLAQQHRENEQTMDTIRREKESTEKTLKNMQMEKEHLEGKGRKYELELSDLKKMCASTETKIAQMSLLAKGTFFAQLQDVMETEEMAFEDGFKNVCGRFEKTDQWRKKEFPDYQTVVLQMKGLVTKKLADLSADDFTFNSESLVSQSNIQKVGRENLSIEEKAILDFDMQRHYERARSISGITGTDDDEMSKEVNQKVELVDSGTITNKGHLFAGNTSCGPPAGIFVQAIVGYDLEKEMDEIDRKERQRMDKGVDRLSGKALQQHYEELLEYQKERNRIRVNALRSLAFHQRKYKGFCHLKQNFLYVPKSGHEKYFDEEGAWIIVPLLEHTKLIDWTPQHGEYWVMFIAGTLTNRDSHAYTNFLQASMSDKTDEHVLIEGRREICSRSDVETGIQNLQLFVKAFADLATGRSRHAGEKQLTPLDLAENHKIPHDFEGLKVASSKLAESQQVTVPKLKENFDNSTARVMKLKITHDSDPTLLPDPMAVAAKGALNWMIQTKQKVFPACRRPSDIAKTCAVATPTPARDFAGAVVSKSESDANGSVDSCTSSFFKEIPKRVKPEWQHSKWYDIPVSITLVSPKMNDNKDDGGDEVWDDTLTQGSFDSQLVPDADVDT